ncbi:unnamed protein product [Phytophthora lilii]|uniref:Unnamed protein product n=1 Tax=Phytophthora lilii TaxID=2077276 RepID=A0A9W6WYL4_9STRA|nr:unnamed protein product [Phytophthora lilii]
MNDQVEIEYLNALALIAATGKTKTGIELEVPVKVVVANSSNSLSTDPMDVLKIVQGAEKVIKAAVETIQVPPSVGWRY